MKSGFRDLLCLTIDTFFLSKSLVLTLHKTLSRIWNLLEISVSVTACRLRNSHHWISRATWAVTTGPCTEVSTSWGWWRRAVAVKSRLNSCNVHLVSAPLILETWIYSYPQHFLDFLWFWFSHLACSWYACVSPQTSWKPLTLVCLIFFLLCVFSFSVVYVCVLPPCLKSLLISRVGMSSADHAGKGESCFYPHCSTGCLLPVKLNWLDAKCMPYAPLWQMCYFHPTLGL